MKTKIIILWLCLSFYMLPLAISQDNNTSERIAAAIKSGNARALAHFFHSTIDLTVLQNDGVYSKAQAEGIIRDFFSNNPPSNFRINHQGSSRDASQYYIGTYSSSGKGNFRVYFLLKSHSGRMLIQNLEIQRQ